MSPSFERRRLGKAKIAILTITEDEFGNARRIFDATIPVRATPYSLPSGSNLNNPDIVLCQALSRSNLPAAQTVARLIEQWRPHFVFLTGTAGGVFDKNAAQQQVGHGDIIVADYIDYVEYSKLTGGAILQRKVAYDHPSLSLRADFVGHVSTDTNWHEWIGHERPDHTPGPPAVHVGNIAAGEKIFADYNNDYQQKLLAIFDKSIAVEMESYGVASAICEARYSIDYNPQFLSIRGMSDYVNSPESNRERADWTPYAASAAIAFARAIAVQVLEFLAEREAYNP